MDVTTIIGIAASVFTASSMLPQLIKLLREKKADDISLFMPVVLLTGLVLWIWYGIRKEDWIIIISNGFSVLINITLFILTILYKKN